MKGSRNAPSVLIYPPFLSPFSPSSGEKRVRWRRGLFSFFFSLSRTGEMKPSERPEDGGLQFMLQSWKRGGQANERASERGTSFSHFSFFLSLCSAFVVSGEGRKEGPSLYSVDDSAAQRDEEEGIGRGQPEREQGS